jgi:hypothetical protein
MPAEQAMERLREAALLSIGRACGFAAFGIVCVMIGLSFDPRLMVQTGGLLSLGLAAGLLLRASLAGRGDYRRSEVWLLLPREARPPVGVAERLFVGAVREVYMRFARLAAIASIILWTTAALLMAVGF